jgi:hypothetical protein
MQLAGVWLRVVRLVSALEELATVTAIAELIRAGCDLPLSVLDGVHDHVQPGDVNLDLQICCLFVSYQLAPRNMEAPEARSRILNFMDRCIQMSESPVCELRPVGNSLYAHYLNRIRQPCLCRNLSLDGAEEQEPLFV